MSATKVLVIDRDQELCQRLSDLLQTNAMELEIECDGEKGIDRAQKEAFDLVLFDVMLPDWDGFQLLRRLRKSSQVPVIILTATGDPDNRVLGLRVGADDYVLKPPHPEELLARIRAVLRRTVRSSAAPVEPIRIGDLELTPGTLRARLGGRNLRLTAMECTFLEHLMRSSGQVVSRDDLTLNVHGRQSSPFERNVDTHVSRIRKKLGTANIQILSVRGTGYQLLVGKDSGSL